MSNNSIVPVNTETGEIVEAGASWTPEQIQLIKDTVAKGSTDDELRLFLYNCKRTGLDPLAKQAHYIKRWDSALHREVGSFQTGIDGYRVIAERSGTYAGQDAPIFVMQPDMRLPDSATVTVYRMINGERIGVAATAFYDEYVQTTKDGAPNSMWRKMPRSQLAKCAEALALRKAFPNDLSGIYTYEEMGQADNVPQIPVETEKPKGKVGRPAKNKTEKATETKPEEKETQKPKEPPAANQDAAIQKRIRSKFAGKCNFCGEKHIKPGQEIVLVENVWGDEACYLRSLGQEPPDEIEDDEEPMAPIQIEHLDKLFLDNGTYNDTWIQFKDEYPQFMTIGLYLKWSQALETNDDAIIEKSLSESIRELGIG